MRLYFVVMGCGVGGGSGVGNDIGCYDVVSMIIGLIVIDDGELGVGRARVPLNVLGAVRVLTSDDVACARRGFDPHVTDTAFTRLPPWGPSHAVWVEVADDSDPHSGWLVASRHADEFRRELTEAIAACHGPSGE